MNPISVIYSLYFNVFGKSPNSLFDNLELYDNHGVFLRGKTPEIGNFLPHRFVYR